MMEKNGKSNLMAGAAFIVVFLIWTALILIVDVKPVGQNGTDIGFATFNCMFHRMTGVHMAVYTITDWLGLIPIAVCIGFAVLGMEQLIRRRSLMKVDSDIIILGIYYFVVIMAYLIFEMIPINYRPILIDGALEASYPSSTALLVLCVMPTLIEQLKRRMKSSVLRRMIVFVTILFSILMTVGRLFSGVHWFTDIAGSVFLSAGLYLIYRGAVMLSICKRNERVRGGVGDGVS